MDTPCPGVRTEKLGFSDHDIETLKERIAKVEDELVSLKETLNQAERKASAARREATEESKWPLASEDYERYARQMILPGFGVEGETVMVSCHEKNTN